MAAAPYSPVSNYTLLVYLRLYIDCWDHKDLGNKHLQVYPFELKNKCIYNNFAKKRR